MRFPPETFSGMLPEASLRTMADECEDLDAIFFMADLATYKIHPNDGSFADEWDNNLQRFRRFCKLPWYTEKDVILLFLNIDKLSMKPLNVHASSHKHENSHARTVDDIVKSFVSLNKDESREIHVIFADNDDKAKNLESLDGVMKLILSKKANLPRDSQAI